MLILFQNAKKIFPNFVGAENCQSFKLNPFNFVKFSFNNFTEDKKGNAGEKKAQEKPAKKEKVEKIDKNANKAKTTDENKNKQGKGQKETKETAQPQAQTPDQSSAKKPLSRDEEEEEEDEEMKGEIGEIDYSKIDDYSPKKKIYLKDDEEKYIVVQKEKPAPRKPINKNEKYDISHNYEKKTQVSKKEKQNLENLVTQMLRKEQISNQKAKEIKQEIRDPLNYSYARHLNKIMDRQTADQYVQDFSDVFFYHRTFHVLDRLIKYQREVREENNPNFIQIRSLNKLTKNEDMWFKDLETKDVRQNVNSPDWLKTQPRISEVPYNYNIEENKEFHRKFSQFVEEDKQKTLEKQKLLKYIKLNPDSQQVRLRFIPRYLPDGVTPDMIPDFDVDITGYRPEITKSSRRKYRTPRVDTDFTNYEAWRCFDRVYHTFSEDYDFLKVELIPKYFLNRFGPPSTPQHPNFTGMFYFEDENLDLFLVGDHKQTMDTWGPNYPEEFYEEQEKTVKPEWHIKKWPSYLEFWSCTEPKEFRIYYARHSEVRKFKRWLKVYVNFFNPEKDKTLDQILDEKFGKMDDYTDYKLERKNDTIPAIYHYSPKFFMGKEEKVLVDHDPFEHPKYISPKEGEIFDYEDMLKEEAKKGIKRDKDDIAALGEEKFTF